MPRYRPVPPPFRFRSVGHFPLKSRRDDTTQPSGETAVEREAPTGCARAVKKSPACASARPGCARA